MDDQRQGMAHLRKLLEESVGGRGRIAMVTGAVATGKSELLHGFADQALEQGALPLSATGSRAERDLPLGVLSQLVRNTPTDEHRTATLDLLREGSRARMSRDPGAESFEHVDVQIVDALCTVLLKQSERRPLVIVVDDVHHADRASQLCLSYLARRVTYAQIMLVFSVPDHHAHLRTLLHTEMARQPHCHAVRLAHLSAEGVAARVRRRAGAQAADLFAARCHELSGGNRLLVDALLEDLQATGEPGERYADAVLACLHRADPGLLPVARALAVLGEPGTAGRLLGQGEATTARAAQALTGAGLLAGGRFRHEAAASAVLAGLDGAELVDLHRRAAELTYQEGAPAPVVATHLLTASHAGDPWALSVLEEAARQALRDDGVESAIEYLKLALRACDDGRRRARIATTLVRATWRIDPGTPTGHLAELTEALHKGDLGGADAIVLARALLWHGHVADAKDVLSRLGELDREALAELAATRAWCRGSWPAFLPHLPEPPAEQASATARSLGADRRLESADALASALREGPSAELAQTAERVLRGSRLDEMSMDAVECALLTLTFTDRADRAAPWCDAFVTEAAGRHAPSRQARLSAIRAEIALRRGDLAAAARDAQRALDLISPDSWGVAVGAPLGVLLMAGAAMGRRPRLCAAGGPAGAGGDAGDPVRPAVPLRQGPLRARLRPAPAGAARPAAVRRADGRVADGRPGVHPVAGGRGRGAGPARRDRGGAGADRPAARRRRQAVQAGVRHGPARAGRDGRAPAPRRTAAPRRRPAADRRRPGTSTPGRCSTSSTPTTRSASTAGPGCWPAGPARWPASATRAPWPRRRHAASATAAPAGRPPGPSSRPWRRRSSATPSSGWRHWRRTDTPTGRSPASSSSPSAPWSST